MVDKILFKKYSSTKGKLRQFFIHKKINKCECVVCFDCFKNTNT